MRKKRRYAYGLGFLNIRQANAISERNKKMYINISASIAPKNINPNHKNNIGIINKDKMNAKNLFIMPIVLNLLYVNTVTKVIPNGGITKANKEAQRNVR